MDRPADSRLDHRLLGAAVEPQPPGVRRPARLALVVLLAASLGACGEQTAATGGGEPRAATEPTTSRALAAVAASVTGEPSHGSDPGDTELMEGREVAAELRFGATGEYDGDLLVVAVGREPVEDFSSCATAGLDPCVDIEGGVLHWITETPEEDPGGVYVAVAKGRATAFVGYSGSAITGDPRELDLPISVADLRAVAADPRVDETTTAEAVAAGEDLTWWRE